MERLLHYVWKYKLFPLSSIQTTEGDPVEVIDPGLINRNAGPDFFNAKVKIGGTLWVGNVEVHYHASDWVRHGHGTDPAYDSVILHVVGESDAVITRFNGEKIPQVIVKVPASVRENYETLKSSENLPACVGVLPGLPFVKIHAWMSALVSERFEQKTEAIRQRLEAAEQDWETAFFVTLARNFGFGVNSDAFERWARSIPLGALAKHRDNLMQVEALFFGQSGLLDEEVEDAYLEILKREYAYLVHKFNLSAPVVMCKLLRMRPGNFPHVRIAQLARLYHEKPGLFSQLMEEADLDRIFELLQTHADGYWEDHLLFGRLTAKAERRISLFSLRLLVINTVVPFLYAYGIHRGNEIMKERATRFLEEMASEENHVIRSWRAAGIQAENAADSQALIELTREYCEKRKCLFCRFGYEYLKKTSG